MWPLRAQDALPLYTRQNLSRRHLKKCCICSQSVDTTMTQLKFLVRKRLKTLVWYSEFYTRVFNLFFLACSSHNTENRIDKFLAFYREAFPGATITPKLHMLEDHVVPFLRQWKIGLGFLGEQGAESIHARFNSIRRNYSSMPNSVQQLECILKEHFNQVCPDNVVRLPQPRKRAKKSS